MLKSEMINKENEITLLRNINTKQLDKDKDNMFNNLIEFKENKINELQNKILDYENKLRNEELINIEKNNKIGHMNIIIKDFNEVKIKIMKELSYFKQENLKL